MDARDAVVCEPVRTAVGRAGGVFRDVPAADLASTVLRSAGGADRAGSCRDRRRCFRAGVPERRGPSDRDGWPRWMPATRSRCRAFSWISRCGSGLQSVAIAAMQVQTGVSDLVVAGGADSMSQVEFYSTSMRYGAGGGGVHLHDRLTRARVTAGGEHYPVPGGMIETAENLRREYQILAGRTRRVCSSVSDASGGRHGGRPVQE